MTRRRDGGRCPPLPRAGRVQGAARLDRGAPVGEARSKQSAPRQFIEDNNRVLERFSDSERERIGIHTCPGSDQDSAHSLDVRYHELLPSLLQLKAGNFYIQMASEKEYIPVDRLGSADDCGFAPLGDDTSTLRETAFAKIRLGSKAPRWPRRSSARSGSSADRNRPTAEPQRRQLPRQQSPRPRRRRRRAGPWRHDGDLVGRRDLWRGVPARAGDLARPVRDPPGVGRAAVARLVIGNCSYVESGAGVAVTDGAGPRTGFGVR